MSHPTRVLVADAQTTTHITVTYALMMPGMSQFCLLPERATSYNEATTLCQMLQPDTLLMALNLLPPPRETAVLNLKQHAPNLNLIIVANREDKVCLLHLIQAGVVGYLWYSDSFDCWVSCLRAMITNGCYFPQAALAHLGGPDDEVLQFGLTYGLTERECQILVLLNRGLDNQRIATAMGLTDHTVRNYKCTIKKKIGIQDRQEIVSLFD